MRTAKPSLFSPHHQDSHRLDESSETLAAWFADPATPAITLAGSMTSATDPLAFFFKVFFSILVFSLFACVFLGAVLALAIPKTWVDPSLFELWVVLFGGLLAWTAVRGRAWQAYRHRHEDVGSQTLELNLDKGALVRTLRFQHRPERNEVRSLAFAELRLVYRYSDSGADGDACQPTAGLYLMPRRVLDDRAGWYAFGLHWPICQVYPHSDEEGRQRLAPLAQALEARTGIRAG